MMNGILLQDQKFKWAITGFIMILHMAFLSKNVDLSLSFEDDSTKSKIIKIKLQSQKRQIVQTHNKEKVDQFVDSKFLSAQNSMVDRQTKARVVDLHKVGSSGKNGEKNDDSDSKPEKQKLLDKLKFSDIAMTDLGAKGISDFKKSKKKGLRTQDRTTHKDVTSSNDHLEDVALGDFTKLNTQEYEFYGFYHRIRQKLEQFWGRNLRTKAEKLFKAGRRIPANQNHVTAVLITLNKKGEIVKVKVKATSGVRELDDAAINSFNQAGPFPNPPTKMVKDGNAVIRWDFVVNS